MTIAMIQLYTMVASMVIAISQYNNIMVTMEVQSMLPTKVIINCNNYGACMININSQL